MQMVCEDYIVKMDKNENRKTNETKWDVMKINTFKRGGKKRNKQTEGFNCSGAVFCVYTVPIVEHTNNI